MQLILINYQINITQFVFILMISFIIEFFICLLLNLFHILTTILMDMYEIVDDINKNFYLMFYHLVNEYPKICLH